MSAKKGGEWELDQFYNFIITDDMGPISYYMGPVLYFGNIFGGDHDNHHGYFFGYNYKQNFIIPCMWKYSNQWGWWWWIGDIMIFLIPTCEDDDDNDDGDGELLVILVIL